MRNKRDIEIRKAMNVFRQITKNLPKFKHPEKLNTEVLLLNIKPEELSNWEKLPFMKSVRVGKQAFTNTGKPVEGLVPLFGTPIADMIYYQPNLKDEEWGEKLFSFEVYRSMKNAQKDFPGYKINQYSGDDVEEPCFVD